MTPPTPQHRVVIMADGERKVLGEYHTFVAANIAGSRWRNRLRGNGEFYIVDVPPKATTFRKIEP